MGRAWYTGAGGKARRTRKIYAGIPTAGQAVARRVKKAYVGVNGKAQLCFLFFSIQDSTWSQIEAMGFTWAGLETELGAWQV